MSLQCRVRGVGWEYWAAPHGSFPLPQAHQEEKPGWSSGRDRMKSDNSTPPQPGPTPCLALIFRLLS